MDAEMEVVGAQSSSEVPQEMDKKPSSADIVPGEKILSLIVNDLPWIEKYRPKSLSELIAHEEIVNICQFSSFLSSYNLFYSSIFSEPFDRE
jgi:hypothetical protein